ncbi:MAG: HAD hydrolase family protein [Gemmatimonadaceae bacterium]|jgi:3-deoxy-D-manno-octulosonate 8-phosphate phosphatase (KDO 8-P phosphatase)|nr:HAD hydrolase family protein [Gemmatimonadaceae bacterium]
MMSPAEARAIALVCLDVDGTLTDNGVYLGQVATDGGAAVELKKFHVGDGLGIKMLQRAGIEVAFISARESVATAMRARELGVRHCYQSRTVRKVVALDELTARLGIPLDRVAFVGDDLADIPVMRRVGCPVAPANAAPEVAAIARVRLTRAGGDGAVREFTELVLRTAGRWDALVADYVAEASMHVAEAR